MKKHRTQVPDFSHKRVVRPDADAQKAHPHAPPPPQPPQPKPRSTSAKSGRRGQERNGRGARRWPKHSAAHRLHVGPCETIAKPDGGSRDGQIQPPGRRHRSGAE